MTETEWKWLIVPGIVVTVVAYRMLTARHERLRRAWFDDVAKALKATPEHSKEQGSRCITTRDGRTFEITHGYTSERLGSDYSPGWAFRIATKLDGVSDIYSISFRRKRGGELETRLFGFEPRPGWDTSALRRAIMTLFESASRRDTVDLEGGALRFRSYSRPDGEAVRRIIAAQTLAAGDVQRAL